MSHQNYFLNRKIPHYIKETSRIGVSGFYGVHEYFITFIPTDSKVLLSKWFGVHQDGVEELSSTAMLYNTKTSVQSLGTYLSDLNKIKHQSTLSSQEQNLLDPMTPILKAKYLVLVLLFVLRFIFILPLRSLHFEGRARYVWLFLSEYFCLILGLRKQKRVVTLCGKPRITSLAWYLIGKLFLLPFFKLLCSHQFHFSLDRPIFSLTELIELQRKLMSMSTATLPQINSSTWMPNCHTKPLHNSAGFVEQQQCIRTTINRI